MRASIFLAAVLALVLGAGAARAEEGDLGVVGDSLTFIPRARLRARLGEAGWRRVEIDAQVSRRIPLSAPPPYSGVQALRELRDGGFDPEALVIALGTNDLGFIARRWDKPRALVEEMLAAIGPGHRVLWVDVAMLRPNRTAVAWNRLLDEIAAERRGELVVYHFSRVATGRREWFAPDRIHMTEAGYAARSALIALASRALLTGEIPAEAYGPPAAAEALLGRGFPTVGDRLGVRASALIARSRLRAPMGRQAVACGADRSWLRR
jgi:hypothetical protein